MNEHKPAYAGTFDSDERVLDHPVWASLSGPHSGFSERRGGAARYPSPIAPFAARAPGGNGDAWVDLAKSLGPDGAAVLVGEDDPPPEGWVLIRSVSCVQMVDVGLNRSIGGWVVGEVLGPGDVPEMLELVERTRPGPFTSRTVELGMYLGLRRHGMLVAMAGQRLHPPGWTEVSAVCTHPDHRGRGLASGLVRSLCAEIRSRGETPFLHAAATNVGAIGLYESLGFVIRRPITFAAVRGTGGTR